MSDLQPIDVALVLEWYRHWNTPQEIAEEICGRFDDDVDALAKIIRGGLPVSNLPPEASRIYVELAVEEYGEAVINRNTSNGVRD